MSKELIPGYTVDHKGFRAEADIHPFLNRVGIWRPIDIDFAGQLVIQQPRPLIHKLKGGDLK